MNILYVILLTLALAAICVGFVFLTIRQLSVHKAWLIAADVIIGLVFCMLMIWSVLIPKRINAMMAASCEYMEQQINIIQPDYSNNVLDAGTIKELMQTEKHFSIYLHENDTANLVVRLIGGQSYLRAMDAVVSNMDSHLSYFEQNSIPLTLHNILAYTQDISQPAIFKVVKILQWVIVALAVLLYLVWILVFCAIKFEWINKPSVTYGETI